MLYLSTFYEVIVFILIFVVIGLWKYCRGVNESK